MFLRTRSKKRKVTVQPRPLDGAVRCAVEWLEDRLLLSSSGLQGDYFNNPNLTGAPAATRIDKMINFLWTGAPGVAGVGGDNFSVRWTGQVTPKYSGAYTFLTRSDDGVRLYVNGTKVIDNWTRHAATTNISGAINLVAGQKADVKLEFFDASGGALSQLFWQSKSQAQEVIPESALSNDFTPPTTNPPPDDNPPPNNPPPTNGSGDGLLGTYFDNEDFTGQKLTRVDPQVAFNWAAGSPDPSIAPDTFSVRWTGQVQAQKTETYTFYTKTDDGVKLFINGQMLINKLVVQGPTEYAVSVPMVAGQKYAIQLDYFEHFSGAGAYLSWSSPTTPKQVIPKSQLFSGGTVTPPPTVPAAPAGFGATGVSASQIKLAWQDVANETLYKLERSPDGATNWTQIATPAAGSTSYTDSNLAPTTKYFYRLRASNSAGDSAYTAVVNATTQATPPPANGTYQPDAVIQIHHDTTFIGDNVYNSTGAGQTKDGVGEFYPTIFKIRIYNDGNTPDSFIVSGPAGDAQWRVSYYDSFTFGWNGGVNVTSAVTAGAWNTGNVDPGQYRELRAEVLPLTAPGGDFRALNFTVRSAHDPSKVDVVRGTVTNNVVRAVAWRRQNFDDGGAYLMTVQNQGNLPDQITINGVLGAGSGWTAQFFDDNFGGNDITSAVRSGAGWKTKVLQPWESQEFRVVFHYTDPNAPSVQLTASSAAKPDSKEQIVVNVSKPEDHPVGLATGDVFPIGVWTQPVASFDKWKSRGVNTLIEYQGDGATIEQWSQAARDRGMFYIRRPLSNPALDKGDTNLLAWALPDEPEITSKYPPDVLASWVAQWKAADPTRPVWVNFSGGWVLHWQGGLFSSDYQKFLASTDWVSSSIYPVTGWYRPGTTQGLDAPGQSVDRLEKWSNGQPQWAVIESGDQELSWIQKDIPGPNPGQFRAEVWDSVIHGAKGVIYFPESFMPGFKFDNTPPEIAAEMTSVDAKLQSIAGALLSETDPPTRGLAVDGPLEGTWRVKDGKTYYVVLNFSDQAVTKNVTLQGVDPNSVVTVNGENRTLNLTNGTLSDSFTPFSVHVYQVG